MIILGDNITLRCDSCGSQMGMGRTNVEALHRRMPTGWMALDKGRHACPLCSPSAVRPMSFRY